MLYCCIWCESADPQVKYYIVLMISAMSVVDSDPSRYEIIAGAWKRDGQSSEQSVRQRRSVSQVIVHPDYNSATENNDIALLKLSTELTFNENITAVCLPTNSSDLYVNRKSFVAGWGATSSGIFSRYRFLEFFYRFDVSCHRRFIIYM